MKEPIKIQLTIDELESLLRQQRDLTIEKCLQHTSYYNKESTDGHTKSLPIDEDKFKENGRQAKYPNDFEVLKRYLS